MILFQEDNAWHLASSFLNSSMMCWYISNQLDLISSMMMISIGTSVLLQHQLVITKMQKKDFFKFKMKNTRMTTAILAGYVDVIL